ncbi:CubicO group peptidase, beta-lactamase class C family [Pedobacter terrae]|uniref:CubicO group peptidase, beta-lactamase class C family n=1 Tax=Pedobacter terrae TaxID=405671 RepID=A0A1G7Z416_9SPHI|nr:serine hydrolase domain-containing protein [Pedobacter terrae]SDH03404.1 CubicO group peptidase, beta-lactamase class C family [Pedobacter terrae]
MIKKLTLFAVLIILAQFSFSQSFDKNKLDAYFDTLGQYNKFMGSVAIAQNGHLIYNRTLGFANLKERQTANENTKYRIGSISKTFTAALIFKAIEEKKISLNQTIQKFFPDIKNAEKISISNLLYHRSGIHDFTDDQEGYLKWHTQPKTEKEMLAIISKGGIDFEPDTQSDYSNSNYLLLSYILEKTFKMPYAQILDKYIAKPLKLKNTFLGKKINLKNNEASSYRFEGDWKLADETDISIPMGAGGIVSTPIDLVKFSTALFGGKVISQKSLAQMKTLNGKYGMGVLAIPFYDQAGFGHSGSIDGFSATFSYFSDGNIAYALTGNGTNFNNNSISLAVLSAVFNKEYQIPDFKTVEQSTTDLNKYLGIYASTAIPIKITITKDNTTLVARATGQSATKLTSKGNHEFKFEEAGIILSFNPTANQMTLKQGGKEFKFTKE